MNDTSGPTEREGLAPALTSVHDGVELRFDRLRTTLDEVLQTPDARAALQGRRAQSGAFGARPPLCHA